jgi:hypothetical protein
MSTAAQPRLDVQYSPATHWASWAIFATDAIALEAAFALALLVRRLLSFWFSADIGLNQYLGVALGILLLPAINYQLGLYPGYMLGPVERLRRRTLARRFRRLGGLGQHSGARDLLPRCAPRNFCLRPGPTSACRNRRATDPHPQVPLGNPRANAR